MLRVEILEDVDRLTLADHGHVVGQPQPVRGRIRLGFLQSRLMRSSDTGDGSWPGSRLGGAACANAVVGDNTAIASTTAAKRFMSVLDASARRTSSEKEADLKVRPT